MNVFFVHTVLDENYQSAMLIVGFTLLSELNGEIKVELSDLVGTVLETTSFEFSEGTPSSEAKFRISNPK